MRIESHPLNDKVANIGWRYIDPDTEMVYPWYTVGCLEWLATLDLKSMDVFEYGCGLSSTWWKHHVKSWAGVDHDPRWGTGALITNVQHEYIHSPGCGPYDIVVVDGIYRVECVQHAANILKAGGHLIVDNWDQDSVGLPASYWQPVKDLLEKYTLAVYKEPKHIDWKTAVYRIG